MEPISFCLGVLPIFKACLDYFDYFKTAKSLHFDCQVLLLKLDFEYERMIIWGEKHRVFSTAGDGNYNTELDNPQVSNRLSKALGLIKALFSDGERLKSQYGVRLLENDPKTNNDNGSNEKFVSTSALKRISQWRKTQKANGDSEKKPSILGKLRWAIHDKAKFEVLIRDIRELVSGLYDVLPVPDKERNKIALGDIKELLPDIGRLKQVEEASEDIYPAWSEVASIIVLASEMGSLWSTSASHSRDIQQAVQQTFDDQESEDEQGRIDSALSSTRVRGLYLVYTPECPSNSLASPCTPETLGELSLKTAGPTFTWPGKSFGLSLGQRITQSINPKFNFEAQQMLQNTNYECDSLQKLAVEASLPAASVEVYCAPCACAIRTALLLCAEQSTQLIKYTTRVDERIPVSCSGASTAFDCLSGLLLTIQLAEVGRVDGHLESHLLQYLDRIWVEKRLYELETTIVSQHSRARSRQRLTRLVAEVSSKYAVFIGELDDMRQVARVSAFPQLPRPPRVNEIYKLGHNKGWRVEFMGTFTPADFGSISLAD